MVNISIINIFIYFLIISTRLRIPSQNVFYYRSPDHNKNYVMSFAFQFDNEEDTYQVIINYYYY